MKSKPNDIKDLEKRIKSFEEKDKTNLKTTSGRTEGAKIGLRIVIDFVSAVFIGGTLGYFLDITLETKPLLLIFLLFCGAGAGFLNIYRFLKNKENEENKNG